MPRGRQYYRATLDEIPHPFDILVMINYPASDGESDVHLVFERDREFYARHLIANAWWLFREGFRVVWYDLKGLIKGDPKRPIETINEFEERRTYNPLEPLDPDAPLFPEPELDESLREGRDG